MSASMNVRHLRLLASYRRGAESRTNMSKTTLLHSQDLQEHGLIEVIDTQYVITDEGNNVLTELLNQFNQLVYK